MSYVTEEQKRQLYKDGYVVFKNAVSADLVDEARRRATHAEAEAEAAKKDVSPGSLRRSPLRTDTTMTDLVNASSVTPIMNELMGQFDPPTLCQIGIKKPSKPGEQFNQLGYHEKDQPYYAAEPHLDGTMTIAIPQTVQEGTPEEIYNRYIASGPAGDLGRSPEVLGHNMVPMFEDPEMTLGLGSFTALLFVCLNDQTREGCGQTTLLPGAHHEVQKFLRWQYETSGHVGVEGPGWPRLNHDVPNRCGLVYLPEAVRDQFIDETSGSTPDGKKWPRPTQILMEPGDVCVAMYHCPHSGSRNEHGTESRKTIIFRVRNKRHQPNIVVNGVSDHPDRGQKGEWLTFEEGNDPWERSKYAMCNMWHQWEGMRDVVAQEKRRRG